MSDHFNKLNLCRIRPSKVHGLGVFANANIKSGTVLDTVKPFRIDNFTFYIILLINYFLKFVKNSRKTNFQKIIFLNKFQNKLEAHFVPSPLCYLNHSENPNIMIDYIGDFYIFKTTVDIKKGEEFFLRYKSYKNGYNIL